MPRVGKSLLRAAWLSIAGAGIFFGAYPFKEQPIPAHLKGFDHNRDNRLEQSECIEVAAALIDQNFNREIDSDEDATGEKLMHDLYKAWGINNFCSAWELRNAIRAIKKISENNRIEQEWIDAINNYWD